jgi:small subunit ribosomal protein S2
MTERPRAIWVVDTKKENIAVNEARKLGLPVVAILDTNCDPDEVDYPIPGNDDAIRAGALLTRIVADAVIDGMGRRGDYGAEISPGGPDGEPELIAEQEPLADWELQLLAEEEEEKRRREIEEEERKRALGR